MTQYRGSRMGGILAEKYLRERGAVVAEADLAISVGIQELERGDVDGLVYALGPCAAGILVRLDEPVIVQVDELSHPFDDGPNSRW